VTCPCCAARHHPHALLTRRAALGLGLGGAAALAGCGGAGGALGELGAQFVSPEQERELGSAAFSQIREQTPVSRDPAQNARVARVAERIVAVSGSEIPASRWDFVVFDSPQPNAFALPGGHVGVYSGMFRVAQSDAELATVIGHEVGHVNARHAAQRVGASQITDLGVALAGAALDLGGVAGGQALAGALGVGAQYGVILPFSRGQELEADKLGVTYMARAGYDPRASIGFWRKMAQATRGGGPDFLSTHPNDEARIAQLEALMPEAERVYRGATRA
jgi:metalloendopeptidase OMA1, mitochondrial